MCLWVAPTQRFPSVRLQSLEHLSVQVESAVYRLVAQPVNQNCVRNCVRHLNLLRSLTDVTRASFERAHQTGPNVRYSPVNAVRNLRPEARRRGFERSHYESCLNACAAEGSRKTRTQLVVSRPSSTHLLSSSLRSSSESGTMM